MKLVSVTEHPMLPGSWQVEGTGSNGEVYLALFGGNNAKQLAEEYAQWRYT